MGRSHKGKIGGLSKSYVVMDDALHPGPQNVETFVVTVTLTSAQAAAGAIALTDALVGVEGRKVYVDSVKAKVNGAVAWATTANVFVEDTTGAAFVTIPVANLAANAFVSAATANNVLSALYTMEQGGAANAGLRVRGNANGTGSDLVLTLKGYIR